MVRGLIGFKTHQDLDVPKDHLDSDSAPAVEEASADSEEVHLGDIPAVLPVAVEVVDAVVGPVAHLVRIHEVDAAPVVVPTDFALVVSAEVVLWVDIHLEEVAVYHPADEGRLGLILDPVAHILEGTHHSFEEGNF